jgi:D-alanine-D-alanine ligase
MRIGLTYDLRSEYLAMGYSPEETAEFDREETIEHIEGALRELGYETVRIGHLRSLVAVLARGERWDAVFNICEGIGGYGREAQVPALLEAYGIPYTFSDPLVACLSLHKGLTKRVLRDQGVPTTDFRLVEGPADIEAVDLPFPLFVKPVAEGTAKGVHPTSRVTDKAELARECTRLLAQFRQPVIVEPFLSGREFTTGLVGHGPNARAVGTIEIVLMDTAEAHAYTYTNKEESEERVITRRADPEWSARCAVVALSAWRALGCRDAGRVDLRANERGELMVMEANPLPGMHAFHSDLPIICSEVGFPYRELVREVIEAALARGKKTA